MSNYSLFPPQKVPWKRPIRLRTASDARKFIAKILNNLYRETLDPNRAARLGYLAGIFLKSIEVADLEKRLAELEKALLEKE
jgi:hypothetical protein